MNRNKEFEEKIEAENYKELLEDIKQLEEEIGDMRFSFEDTIEDAQRYLSTLKEIKEIKGDE